MILKRGGGGEVEIAKFHFSEFLCELKMIDHEFRTIRITSNN